MVSEFMYYDGTYKTNDRIDTNADVILGFFFSFVRCK